MQVDVTVISDSEPERLAAPPRRTIAKPDKGKAKAQIEDLWTLPSPAQRPRPASISSSVSSSSSKSASVKPRVPKASKSSFTSASKVLKSQEKRKALQAAAVSPVASTSKASQPLLSSDDDLPPPLDLTPAYASAGPLKTAKDSPAHQSAEESEEESPRGVFARTLSSRFAYEPNSKSTAIASKKPNYFKRSDTSASDSLTSKVPVASTSKTGPAKKEEAIPLPLIALLEDCPVCSIKWTTKKSSPVKLSHILKCAATQEWEIATVLKVIKKHIQSLKAAQDQAKRDLEEERTLFDGVVGGKKVDVNVVGVASGALIVPRTQGGSIQADAEVGTAQATTYAVEDELAAQKKKSSKTKSASTNPKLAKALKLLEKDPLPSQTQSSSKSTKSTLKTYDQSKPVIDKRAKDLMDTYYGSGLTQVPVSSAASQARSASAKTIIDVDALDDSMDIDDILPAIGIKAKPKAASVPILAPTPLSSLNQLNEAYKAASALYEPGSILRAAQKASTSTAESRLWDLASCEEDVTERANKPSSSSTSSILNFTSSKPFTRDNSSKEGFLKPTQPVEQRVVPAKKKTSDLVPSTSKKSAKATTGKAATAPEPERAPTSDRSKMPDYSTWTIEQLQKQSGKYGYKVSVERSVNITRLEQVWDALHPLKLSPSVPSSPKTTTKAKAKPKVKAASPSASEASSDDVPLADLPASPRKRTAAKAKDPAARKKKAIAAAVSRRTSDAEAGRSDGDFMEEEEEVVTVKGKVKRKVKDKVQEAADFNLQMRKLVIEDSVLWHRILRYEPVLFDDFVALAESKDLKASKIGMRNFLDAMQISFYLDQTTRRNADGGRGRQRKKVTTEANK